MNTIEVKKNELIKVLKANRKKHREIFEEALVGYRKKVIEELDNRLRDAREGRKINIRIALQEPMDQTSDYDRIIGMLELGIDTTIKLSEHEYRLYVQDDWTWKGQFNLTNSVYVNQEA